jgi:hypothetical protein
MTVKQPAKIGVKSGQSILKFESIEVEKRSLSVYEALSEA